MPGSENNVQYSKGYRLEASGAEEYQLAQKTSTDVSELNVSGDPEGVVPANPGSVAHDRTNGAYYLKVTGTGNTGWSRVPSSTSGIFADNKIIRGDGGGSEIQDSSVTVTDDGEVQAESGDINSPSFSFNDETNTGWYLAAAGNLVAAVNGSNSFTIKEFSVDVLKLLNAFASAQIDNISISGNTISSTDTDGNITITPDGTGVIAGTELTLTTALDEIYGGTGQSTYATGDILYSSASNTLSKLAAGSNTEVLTLAGGVPTWAAAAGGSNNYHPNFIVDASSRAGYTHTTIAAAIASASTGDVIGIRSGTYTEDNTLTVALKFVGLGAAAYDGSIQVTGKWTIASAISVLFANIRFVTNSDYFLVQSHASATTNYLNCYFGCTNNTGFNVTGGAVKAYNCQGNIATTGITFGVFSTSQDCTFNDCNITNTGAATTATMIGRAHV